MNASTIKLDNRFAYEAIACSGLNLTTASLMSMMDAVVNAILDAQPGIDEDLAEWSAYILVTRIKA